MALMLRLLWRNIYEEVNPHFSAVDSKFVFHLSDHIDANFVGQSLTNRSYFPEGVPAPLFLFTSRNSYTAAPAIAPASAPQPDTIIEPTKARTNVDVPSGTDIRLLSANSVTTPIRLVPSSRTADGRPIQNGRPIQTAKRTGVKPTPEELAVGQNQGANRETVPSGEDSHARSSAPKIINTTGSDVTMLPAHKRLHSQSFDVVAVDGEGSRIKRLRRKRDTDDAMNDGVSSKDDADRSSSEATDSAGRAEPMQDLSGAFEHSEDPPDGSTRDDEGSEGDDSEDDYVLATQASGHTLATSVAIAAQQRSQTGQARDRSLSDPRASKPARPPPAQKPATSMSRDRPPAEPSLSSRVLSSQLSSTNVKSNTARRSMVPTIQARGESSSQPTGPRSNDGRKKLVVRPGLVVESDDDQEEQDELASDVASESRMQTSTSHRRSATGRPSSVLSETHASASAVRASGLRGSKRTGEESTNRIKSLVTPSIEDLEVDLAHGQLFWLRLTSPQGQNPHLIIRFGTGAGGTLVAEIETDGWRNSDGLILIDNATVLFKYGLRENFGRKVWKRDTHQVSIYQIIHSCFEILNTAVQRFVLPEGIVDFKVLLREKAVTKEVIQKTFQMCNGGNLLRYWRGDKKAKVAAVQCPVCREVIAKVDDPDVLQEVLDPVQASIKMLIQSVLPAN
ncbi:hypothetical protein HDU93_001872 [Gonapodya sp. JEL0774]|nr:hypothetical protein HDU93_001872 [Gonapodya sp. JEL0774]